MFALPQVDFEAGTVPGLAVVVSYVLVVASIIVLVIYVDHIGKSLRASALIELVGDATRRTLDERYPAGDEVAVPDRDPALLAAPRSGVLSLVDEDTLVHLTREADGAVELHVAIGAFVPAGTQLATLHGGAVTLDHEDILATLVLTLDRNLSQDVAYGIRLLVDIAERSLAESPFVDPTTAVQALDRIHDCMRHLAGRPFPNGERRDEDGVVRIIVPTMGWDDYVQLAFVEIRMAGAPSPQVARRLKEVLDDLIGCAPPGRRPPLERERTLLAAAVHEEYRDQADVEFASTPDRQGVGTGPPRVVRESRAGT
jgi:uncharacterized membrane protein